MEQKLLTLLQIKKGLQDRRLKVVATNTGLSYVTLKKLADGSAIKYHPRTLARVSEYLLSPAIQ